MKKWLFLLFTLACACSCGHVGFTKQQLTKELSSVVSVRVYTIRHEKLTGALESSGWMGTGFGIQENENGSVILTNKHVCSDGPSATYVLTDSLGRKHKASFNRNDEEADLCILTTQAQIPALPLAKENATKGDHLMVIGAPHGAAPYFTEGYASGYTRMDSENMGHMDVKVHLRAMATSVPIYGGNSGSPCLNEKGEVVGIMFAGRNDSEHMSYMVPVSLIHEFLDTAQNLYDISED